MIPDEWWMVKSVYLKNSYSGFTTLSKQWPWLYLDLSVILYDHWTDFAVDSGGGITWMSYLLYLMYVHSVTFTLLLLCINIYYSLSTHGEIVSRMSWEDADESLQLQGSLDKKEQRGGNNMMWGKSFLAWPPQQEVWVCMSVCVCVCACVRARCDVTLMWFKGWEAEMKQSVLDRNAWLADSVLRQKQEEDGSSLEMRSWNVALHEKTNITQQSERKQREKRERICCANICLCMFQNKPELSLRYIQTAL